MRVTRTGGRKTGIVLVALGALFWSTAGVFVRLLDIDLWTMMVWRSLFGALGLALIVLFRQGHHAVAVVRGIGRPGLIAIPISAVSMISFIAALKLTTVANVMMVYATLPFLAAGLSFLWNGERAQRHVLWASGLALLGVSIIAGSATRFDDLAGNGLALVMTSTFAILLVMARRYPAIDMAPVNGFAALIVCAACVPLSGPVPSVDQLGLLALFGFLTSGLAYLLFLTGGRYIPSSEAGLVGFLDVILGPLWVWLLFGEQPHRAVILGGAFVFVAVIWYLIREINAPVSAASADPNWQR